MENSDTDYYSWWNSTMKLTFLEYAKQYILYCVIYGNEM